MAGLTKRFRLHKFGGGVPGTIIDDAQAYTSADRDAIDRLLEQVELHDHHYRIVDGAPTEAPTAVLGTDGSLRGGQTYYYRYSLVGSDGAETLASPEVSVSTPALLPPPIAVGPYVDDAASAGALPPGVYYYALTGLRGVEESPLGAAVAISIAAPDGAITLDLPDYGDADSFRVWRMGMNDVGWTRLGVVASPASTFLDDGSVPADPCASDPGNAPPSFNTGVTAYSVIVDLPAAVDLTGKTAWRLYRSTTSGLYPTAALVHEVVETTDEWDPEAPLVTSWSDVGDQALPGKPLDHDANMRIRPFVFDSAAILPDPAPYPVGYPLLVGEGLYARVGTGWSLVAGGGGGPAAPPILTALDGSRWILTVGADGSLGTVATDLPGAPTPPTGLVVA